MQSILKKLAPIRCTIIAKCAQNNFVFFRAHKKIAAKISIDQSDEKILKT